MDKVLYAIVNNCLVMVSWCKKKYFAQYFNQTLIEKDYLLYWSAILHSSEIFPVNYQYWLNIYFACGIANNWHYYSLYIGNICNSMPVLQK